MYHCWSWVWCLYVCHGRSLYEEMYYFILMKENYYKSNYPTDSSHIPCAYAQNEKYPMVYFPDINDPTTVFYFLIHKRVCVSVCPNEGDKELICRPNSKV